MAQRGMLRLRWNRAAAVLLIAELVSNSAGQDLTVTSASIVAVTFDILPLTLRYAAPHACRTTQGQFVSCADSQRLCHLNCVVPKERSDTEKAWPVNQPMTKDQVTNTCRDDPPHPSQHAHTSLQPTTGERVRRQM